MEPPATKTEMAQPTPLGGGAQLAMPMPAVATSFQAAASQQAVVAMGGAGGDWPESTGTAEATFRKRGRPRKYEGLGEAERRKRRMADNRQSAKRSYYRKVNRMKELEEENEQLRAELGTELQKLAEIDAPTQERMLSVAQRMGQERLNPELLAKYARKEDMHKPLFQHAEQAQADAEQAQEEGKEEEALDAEGAAAAAVGDPGVADAGLEAAGGGAAPGADPMAQTLSAQPVMAEGSGEGGTTAPDRGGGAIEGAPVVLEQNISPGTV